MGQNTVSRSLGTESKSEAERLAILKAAEVQREIDEALGKHPDELSRQFSWWRRAIAGATSDDEREAAKFMMLDHLEDRDRKAAAQEGSDVADLDEVRSTDEHAFNVQGYQYATGQLVRLTEHLDTYLARLQVGQKSIDQYRAGVERISQDCPFVSDVTPASVQAFTDKRLSEGGAVRTIRRELSGARGYWNWLSRRLDIIDSEKRSPFDGVNLPKQSTKKGKQRVAYTQREAVSLLRAAVAKPDPMLGDLIRLAMFTGARIEELCSLPANAADLELGVLKIRDAKTNAGNRDTPIHPMLRPVVERLKADTTDDYLLPGLKRDNKYNKRSNALGKRFSNLKTREGFGANHDFHCFRMSLNTMLLNAGVQDAVVKDIVGHEQEGMTRGVYYDSNVADYEEARRRIQADAIAKASFAGLTDEDMR
ncbi:tyrosine-type recombinase/integrase [Salinisphaera sp. SPP-AMP-43]